MELLAALLALAAPAPEPVTCRMRAEPPPPAPLESRGDARVYDAAVNGARFQLMTTGGLGPARMGERRIWVAKTPRTLTAGGDVVVTLTGARWQDGRARTYAKAPRSIRLTACPADTPLFSEDEGVVGPITGWGGGILAPARRACVRVRVTNAQAPGERPATLTVPLGRKRCD